MDGAISLGRGIEFQGAHKLGFNDRAIGIGCEGRFHCIDRTMPDAQFNALVWLIRHLRELYGDIRILGHRDYNATACPGQFFPLDEVRGLQFRGTTDDVKESDEEQVKRFNKVAEMPSWAKPYMEMLTTTLAKDGLPVIRGDKRGNLDLSLDMIRMAIIFERLLTTQDK